MVVLRLARRGKKKQAFYRVVVADSRRFVNSKFIEIVGWYNPKTKEVQLKNESIEAWLSKGAQPSNSVAKILKDNGIKLPDWVKITEKVSKPKKEAEEAPVAAPAAPAEESTEEAPTVEEKPAEEAAPAEEVTEETKEDAPATEEAPAEEETEEKSE